MAGKRERAVALVAALLFLGTSLGASVLVLVQAHQNKKAQDTAAQVQQQLQNQNSSSTNNSGGTKLEGTKLKDFTPVDKVDSVQQIDLVAGTGDEVKSLDTPLTFHYTGALAKDGTIFQSSHDTGQPITYPLSQLIPGWQKGIPGMKVGGTRRLLIPAALGYGAQSQPGIPANSDLVFDIELVKIGQ